MRRADGDHRSGGDGAEARVIPAAVAADMAGITVAHRHLYWTVEPSDLHPVVVEHLRLGEPLLRRADGAVRLTLGRALAESALLAGRIEFFDLRDVDAAGASWVQAMQFASDADDQLLGAAVLGHAAFVPGWAGRREEMTERVSAARAYARRGEAPALFHAWLDAVEAECLTRCSDATSALAVLSMAESKIADTADPLACLDGLVQPDAARGVQGQHRAGSRPGPPRPEHPDLRPGPTSRLTT